MRNKHIAVEDTTGSNSEIEVVVYAKIGDFKGLQQADFIEHHEQLETTFAKGQRCRVRKVTKDKVVKYYFTYKLPSNYGQLDANEELTTETDQHFYEGFKLVAERYLNKTRYTFNSDKVELNITANGEQKSITIPNVQYEVDVYVNKEGATIDWCKIDVEVDTVLDYIANKFPDIEQPKLNIKVSHLPFKPANSILSMTADDDQLEYIRHLWEMYNLQTP